MTRRIVDNHGNVKVIHAWYMLVNGWEYWQTEPAAKYNAAYGFVQGMVDEWGSFNIDETDQYISDSATGDELYHPEAPAAPEGWLWLDHKPVSKVVTVEITDEDRDNVARLELQDFDPIL